MAMHFMLRRTFFKVAIAEQLSPARKCQTSLRTPQLGDAGIVFNCFSTQRPAIKIRSTKACNLALQTVFDGGCANFLGPLVCLPLHTGLVTSYRSSHFIPALLTSYRPTSLHTGATTLHTGPKNQFRPHQISFMPVHAPYFGRKSSTYISVHIGVGGCGEFPLVIIACVQR